MVHIFTNGTDLDNEIIEISEMFGKDRQVSGMVCSGNIGNTF